jgi:ABC-type multidrug transport system permease subunit
MNLKAVKDALIIAALKSMPDLKRQPLMIVLIGMISSIPLFFIVVFGGQISLGLVGASISTVSFIGISAAIQDITWDRYVKIREMIVAMPVNPLSYAMGVALAPLIVSAPGLVFFLAIAVGIGVLPLAAIGWIVLSLVICWAVVSSIGFIISTYLHKSSIFTLNSMANILGLGLIFMPPVYYPEELLGGFSWVSMIFPTSNVAGLIRAYAGLTSISMEMMIVRWLVLAAVFSVSIILVALKTRWREP